VISVCKILISSWISSVESNLQFEYPNASVV
jgi:hypothetical protein